MYIVTGDTIYNTNNMVKIYRNITAIQYKGNEGTSPLIASYDDIGQAIVAMERIKHGLRDGKEVVEI